MIPYIILFLIPAFMAVGVPPSAPKKQGRAPFIFFCVMIAMMIGFRWQVGGDWSWDIHQFSPSGGRPVRLHECRRPGLCRADVADDA